MEYTGNGYGRTWIEALEGGDGKTSFHREADRGGTPGEKLAREADQREADLALLRALGGDPDLRDNEAAAFDGMLDDLLNEGRRFETLSPKQRAWAETRADELGINPAKYKPASEVPVGRPVETPAVLQKRPLSPPGRRVAEGDEDDADAPPAPRRQRRSGA